MRLIIDRIGFEAAVDLKEWAMPVKLATYTVTSDRAVRFFEVSVLCCHFSFSIWGEPTC